jgi:GT2 family glycosyltransferase
MLTSLENWKLVGGLNEGYSECFEDVEYNMQLLLRGKQNVVDLGAVCYHHESQTRTRSQEKQQRESRDMSERMMPFIKENEKTLRVWAIKI